MKRVCFYLATVVISSSSFCQEYHSDHFHLNIGVKDKKMWDFLCSIDSKIDSIAECCGLTTLASDLNIPLTYDEFLGAKKTNALSTNTFRVYFKISKDFKHLHVLAFSRNYHYKSLDILHDPFHNFSSDQFMTAPLYVIPLNEYNEHIDSSDYEKLISTITNLVIVNLSAKIDMTSEKIYYSYPIDFNDFPHVHSLGFITPDLANNQIPYVARPFSDETPLTDIEKNEYTSTSDTVWEASNKQPFIVYAQNELIGIELSLNYTLINTPTDLPYIDSAITLELRNEFIGLSFDNPIQRKILWANRTSFLNELKDPILGNGLEFLWVNQILTRLQK